MVSKIAQTVAYIRELEVDSKISIKSLSKERGISEGTAYHAIKRAEQEGLVVTLPKVGTKRVKPQANKNFAATIEKIKTVTNARVLTAGRSPKNPVISEFCIGDGSIAEVTRTIAACKNNILCLVGDRPDLQAAALRSGAHLLLTSHATPTDTVLEFAGQNGYAVLQTGLSTVHALDLLSKSSELSLPRSFSPPVREWMQAPQYLHEDDYVFDACGFFEDHAGSTLPVVNKKTQLQGILNIADAYQAAPTLRIGVICRRDADVPVVSEDTPMNAAVQLLFSAGGESIFVTNDDRLTGVLPAATIYAYCQQFGRFSEAGEQDLLSPSTAAPDAKKQVYPVVAPLASGEKDALRNQIVSSLMAAGIRQYCSSQNITGILANTSFYALRALTESHVSLSVDMDRCENGCCAIQLELYSDTNIYARGTAMILPE